MPTVSDDQLTAAGRAAMQHLHPSLARYLGDPNTVDIRQGGYRIGDNVFRRNGLNVENMISPANTIASVLPGRRTIYVDDPEEFMASPGQYVAHEALHIAQSRVNPSIQKTFPAIDQNNKYGNPEDVDALAEQRKNGAKLNHFSAEQQGAIAQFNQSQRLGLAAHQQANTLTPELARQYAKNIGVTNLYMQDLDQMPASVMEPTDPNQAGINTKAMPPMIPTGVAGQYPSPTYQRNSAYAKPGSYTTKLSPRDEAKFQSWVKATKAPWQDTPDADYDMRGYWKAGASGTQTSGFDGKQHYPDTYKTPYHKTFSAESQYATPNAPKWDGDILKDASGNVIADETPKIVGPMTQKLKSLRK